MTRFCGKGIVKELLLLALSLALAGFLASKAFEAYYNNAYPLKYTELIEAACKEKKLPRSLVYAVVHTESGFRPNVVSDAGARGLMQMMPDAFDWVRFRKGLEKTHEKELLFDPATNIDFGTSMLRLLLDEFETIPNALCAYHAGWGSVKKWLADPACAPDGKNVTHIPFPDTAAYVKRVMQTMQMYQNLYHLE